MKSYSLMVAFAIIGLTACGQLDTSAVDKAGTQLKATVSEAALLTDGAAQGEFTAPFVKVRAEELSDDAVNEESALADGKVAAPAKAKAAKLRQAARLLAAAMDRLRASPGDSRLAADLRTQIQQARAALGILAAIGDSSTSASWSSTARRARASATA